MATYLVRIELRGAPTAAIYTSLHEKMEAADFRRWVQFSNGKFKLPTAEYMTEDASQRCRAVRDRADKVTNLVWTNHETLVVEVYKSEICSTELEPWVSPRT